MKTTLTWSYVCGGLALFFIFLLFLVYAVVDDVTQADNLAVVLGTASLITSVVGLSLAYGLRSRRRKTWGSIWGSVILNGTLLTIYMILIVIGILFPE
jgi:hypothetical protein